MPIVTNQLSYENKKPRSQWKDRFIYTMLGLFAGLVSAHNFYLRRYFAAGTQLAMSAVWVFCLSWPWPTPAAARASMLAAIVIFCVEVIWITLELFLVAREPDGDAMNDEARPVRILLIVVFWVAFILLPLGFALLIQGPDSLTGAVSERLNGE